MHPCDNCQKPTINNYSGFYFCDDCVYPKYENLYQEARRFALFSAKYGNSIDPDMMTKKDLLTWYRKCQELDPNDVIECEMSPECKCYDCQHYWGSLGPDRI
jgi:hypothetical protein